MTEMTKKDLICNITVVEELRILYEKNYGYFWRTRNWKNFIDVEIYQSI